jgi:hypothetical protein
MFKVPARNLKEYFSFDPNRKSDLEKLDKFIRASAPALKCYFHAGTPAGQPGMRFKMIGYGRHYYLSKSGQKVEWPIIGVALQKNYISVYVSAYRKKVPLVGVYRDTLNCLRSGENNFSFQSFDDLNSATLSALVAEAADLFVKSRE